MTRITSYNVCYTKLLRIRPDSSITEIAEAEKTLARLETDLRAALRQKARLASMGEGLAKVSHDLRNLLPGMSHRCLCRSRRR